ncbi:MAG: PKD domain-containing protein, partial [Planctomycetes bacterium]|nr:PKD domain-containing protein [Planctomycetota bacterium]
MSARAADAVSGFTHMADISAPRTDVVAAAFYPGVKIASQPVVTDSAGDVVSSKVLMNQNRGNLMIIFDASARGGKYTLHYGGRGGTDRPKKPWSPVPSLLMEVRSKPPGPVNTWPAMKKLARSGEIQGMMFVQNIYQGHNPFGSNDSFITIYRGELVMNEDGSYRLFTASSDDSFVVIDGKLAFSWPGPHGPWDGARGRFGANINLTKGRHTIEYYHAQVSGTPSMALGWCKKEMEEMHIVPPGWFAHTHVAQVTNPRKKNGGIVALFNWSQHELLVFERFQYVRYKFHNRSVGKAKSVLWDFGDGVTSTERDPMHIFTGTPPFRVRLTVKDGDKADTCQIDVPMLTPTSNTTINDRATVENFAKLINTYPFEKLPGAVMQPLFELMDTLEEPLV